MNVSLLPPLQIRLFDMEVSHLLIRVCESSANFNDVL